MTRRTIRVPETTLGQVIGTSTALYAEDNNISRAKLRIKASVAYEKLGLLGTYLD